MIISTKLKLKVIEEKEDKIKFKIEYQNPSLRAKTDRIKDILLLNDFKIKSSNYPEAQAYRNTFYIKGVLKERDDEVMQCDKSFWNKIQKGVSILNNQFLY